MFRFANKNEVKGNLSFTENDETEKMLEKR